GGQSATQKHNGSRAICTGLCCEPLQVHSGLGVRHNLDSVDAGVVSDGNEGKNQLILRVGIDSAESSRDSAVFAARFFVNIEVLQQSAFTAVDIEDPAAGATGAWIRFSKISLSKPECHAILPARYRYRIHKITMPLPFE